MALPDIDEHGIVRSGPFAGLKADEVFAFAEASAASQRESGEGEPRTPAPKNPADALSAASKARTDPMNQFTFAQFERIDEDNFSKTVPDYDKYKEKIAAVKKTMSPDQRAQQGVHKFIYQNVRMDDPEVQRVIFGEIAAPGATEEENAEVPAVSAEEEEPAAPVAPPAKAPAAKATPKPVPSPVAKPTSRTAVSAPVVAKSGLKATPKIIALAERYSMTVDEYLAHLEASGYTQEQLNNLSLPSSARAQPSSRPRSIYDR